MLWRLSTIRNCFWKGGFGPILMTTYNMNVFPFRAALTSKSIRRMAHNWCCDLPTTANEAEDVMIPRILRGTEEEEKRRKWRYWWATFKISFIHIAEKRPRHSPEWIWNISRDLRWVWLSRVIEKTLSKRMWQIILMQIYFCVLGVRRASFSRNTYVATPIISLQWIEVIQFSRKTLLPYVDDHRC